jgi:predicted amidohydrolase YtcJ
MKPIIFPFSILVCILSSCYKGESVDLVIHNARIHTLNDANEKGEAMAIRDGRIIEVGPERQILNKYSAEQEIDAMGKEVYPGFIDAHGHLLSYAQQKLSADLVGSRSLDEVLVRLEKYQGRYNRKVIIGRGWDQSLWKTAEFPDNKRLNELFPHTPVCLIRIDGHALLANDAMLKKAGINAASKINGGIIHLKNGVCTGLLVDNAMLPIYNQLPDFSKKEMMQILLEIQDELFQYGITGVHEAGIQHNDISLFKELIDCGKWDLNLYAMLMPSEENIAFARKNGVYQHKNLTIRSFKVIGDGALGSRGALLKKPYADQHGHFGVLTTSLEKMKEVAAVCEQTGYQMNSHAIGDSTNKLLLDLYRSIFDVRKDHRWRIEHAQVVDPLDVHKFGEYAIFPSVQPTHAVSDQRWAEQRLGKDRMKGAYAYRSLLGQFGMLALGTDFPIEAVDPFMTIHAAVNRMSAEGIPSEGFYSSESLSLVECLKGMTIWAAYAAFQEKELGTLEKGKHATFVIVEQPIGSDKSYRPNFAWKTYIRGKEVYSAE